MAGSGGPDCSGESILKRERPPADTSYVMWLIPAVLAVILLVPAAIFGASIAHDSVAGESDRVESRRSADRARRG